VIEVVDFSRSEPDRPLRPDRPVKLTTLTQEFFIPGFLERDEGEREPPYEKYPWDGVSGVRPFHELAEATNGGALLKSDHKKSAKICVICVQRVEPQMTQIFR